MDSVRYKELELVLQEERRNMHAMELQLRDSTRREETMQTEVERHRLRVESKLRLNLTRFRSLKAHRHEVWQLSLIETWCLSLVDFI